MKQSFTFSEYDVADNFGNRCTFDNCGSEEDAIRQLKSLVNCTKCVDCSNLTNCSYCKFCITMTDCIDCYGCQYCSNCSGCEYCSLCDGLIEQEADREIGNYQGPTA